jgi:putative transcriptional regulator
MATVHEIELSEPDVQAIRADTGQSQSASDGSIGRKKSRRLNRG